MVLSIKDEDIDRIDLYYRIIRVYSRPKNINQKNLSKACYYYRLSLFGHYFGKLLALLRRYHFTYSFGEFNDYTLDLAGQIILNGLDRRPNAIVEQNIFDYNFAFGFVQETFGYDVPWAEIIHRSILKNNWNESTIVAKNLLCFWLHEKKIVIKKQKVQPYSFLDIISWDITHYYIVSQNMEFQKILNLKSTETIV